MSATELIIFKCHKAWIFFIAEEYILKKLYACLVRQALFIFIFFLIFIIIFIMSFGSWIFWSKTDFYIHIFFQVNAWNSFLGSFSCSSRSTCVANKDLEDQNQDQEQDQDKQSAQGSPIAHGKGPDELIRDLTLGGPAG